MTRQLDAWQGAFGDEYLKRNPVSRQSVQRKLADWSAMLAPLRDQPPTSILEVGCNVGQNLSALRLLTDAELFGVEPNSQARQTLVEQGLLDADHTVDGTASNLPFADGAVDLAFTCGVLIHIAPEDLLDSCSEMYRVAGRYILCIEYFSADPVEKPYRGEDGLLYLRDFGSFWLENFPALTVVDFGFFWKRFSGDNVNWWLFEKASDRDPKAN